MPAPSKIARLPAELRQWLHEALVDRAYGDIVPLTEELNAKLREAGIAVFVGKSAVGAESQKLKRAQESIRAATEAAKLLTDGARDDTNARGEAVMALIETEMFDAILAVRDMAAAEGDDPLDKVAAMSHAAKNIATLSRARVNQSKFRLEVEAKAKAAADAVATIAKAGGLSADSIHSIRQQILGITKAAA
jgi:hypothetical protein